MSKVNPDIQQLNQTNCGLISKLGNPRPLFDRQFKLMMSPNLSDLKKFNQELQSQIAKQTSSSKESQAQIA